VKVVCDATALIGLARINALSVLRCYLERLTIPEAVYEDVVIRGKGKPGAQEVKEAGWIEVRKAKDQRQVATLCVKLGRGEAEAIVLAREIDADLLILDDGTARKVAQRMGVAVVGCLGLLKRARQRGVIGRVKPLFDGMREQGFHIGNEYRAVLSQLGEL